MLKKVLFLVLMTSLSVVVSAQLRVKTSGRVTIATSNSPERASLAVGPVNDLHNCDIGIGSMKKDYTQPAGIGVYGQAATHSTRMSGQPGVYGEMHCPTPGDWPLVFTVLYQAPRMVPV